MIRQPNAYRLRHLLGATAVTGAIALAAGVALNRAHDLQLESVAMSAYADGYRTGQAAATDSLTSSPSLTRTCFAWWFNASPSEVVERRGRFCATQCSENGGK